MPERDRIEEIREPYIRATILCPKDAVGAVMDLCQDRRGTHVDMTFLSEARVQLRYDLPLAEVVLDFFDHLKSRTKGYASLDYELIGLRPSDLVKLDILLAGDQVDALSQVVHKDKAYSAGRGIAERLQKQIPRQQFEVAIQAADRLPHHRPRVREAHAQGRDRQVLRRRHHAQEEAAGEAEGGQEADEAGRPDRGAPGGVPVGAADRRRRHITEAAGGDQLKRLPPSADTGRMRLGFHGRLLGALVLTLVGLGAIQYFVLSSATRGRLYEEEGLRQRADASAVARAYTITVPGEVPLNNVNRYLRAITARPGSDDAGLVDRKGLLLVGGTTLGIGVPDEDSHVARVLRSGRQYVGPADDYGTEDGHIISVTPVKGVPGGRHALVVRQDKDVLGSRLGDIRALLLWLGLGGALLAIPAFYFFGGRSLARLHRAAVQRATRDGLTDLPNHRAFQDELERRLSQARRHGGELTLALVDIDDFRFHNDTYGHSHADRTLRQLAAALTAGRAEDVAFRIGGDEFALLLPETTSAAATAAVRGVRERLREHTAADFSAGLAAVTDATEDAESLVNQADVALQEAKRRGGGETVAFGDVEGASVVTAAKTRAVRKLLADGEMDAAYQPIWLADTSAVLGYEGLARPAADRGINGPGEAFDIAGSIGRSVELDDLCRKAVLSGADALPSGALLFVNVTPQSLDGRRLAGDVLAAEVRAAGLEPERVVLEITERFDGRIDRIVAEAARLRALGFKIALDDVGAGNSGLQMMRELELDFVKIDRMVLVRAVTDITARAVLVSVIAFARETGTFVIAEGIEDEEMLALARWPRPAEAELLGAQGVQGYLLGRPGALSPVPAPPRTREEQVLGSL